MNARDTSDRSRYRKTLPLPTGGLRDWLIRTGYFRQQTTVIA